MGALQDVGGRDYLAARALDQPVAFMSLVGRVLPLQVTGENGGALVVDFRWADALPTIEAIENDETPAITVTFVDTTTDVDTVITSVDTDVGEC